MAKPVFFAFYPKDFADDVLVESMSTLQVGAYILLLCKAWQADPPCSLPNDDQILARLARLDAVTWAEVRSGVLSPFTLDAVGRWHQKRLRKEYDKAANTLRQRKDAGSSGGRTTARKYSNAIAPATAIASAGLERDKSGSKSGNGDLSGNLIPNSPEVLGGSGGGFGRNGAAPDFELSPEGLGQLWCSRYRGKLAAERDPYKVAIEFGEWLRTGFITPHALRAEILRDSRDRTEPTWQMKDRLKPHGNGRIEETIAEKDARSQERLKKRGFIR